MAEMLRLTAGPKEQPAWDTLSWMRFVKQVAPTWNNGWRRGCCEGMRPQVEALLLNDRSTTRSVALFVYYKL